MQQQIISAYLSHTGEVVAIAHHSYYILNKTVSEEKGTELVEKINSIRLIETEYWKEMK